MDVNPVPELAASWNMSNEGMTYTFNLVRNARWHDGRPFTSDDVKFTVEKVLIPHHPNGQSNFSVVESIETPNAFTVIFHLKHPFPPFLTVLGIRNAPILPKHIFEGTDIRNHPRNRENPVGTGPFRLLEYVPGDRVVFVRNDNYFMEGKPYLDRLIFKIIPDGTTRTLALEKGEVDYIPLYVPYNDVDRLSRNANIEVRHVGQNKAYVSVYMMLFNLRDPLASNLKVRQAIAHAIDKNEIVKKATFGLETPARGPFSPSVTWAFNPRVPSYERDVARANQLLDGAGQKRNPRGVRFRLELLLGRGLPDEDRTAELIREQLKDVGIEVVLRPLDQAAFMETVYGRFAFQAALRAHSTGPDPGLAAISTYHSHSIRPIPYGNAMGYSNANVDALLEGAISARTRDRARELLFQAQFAIARDLPAVWIRENVYPHAYRKNVKNVPASPFGGAATPLHNVYFTSEPRR
jgi:peptide/nickel transport system substrate-binding protein